MKNLSVYTYYLTVIAVLLLQSVFTTYNQGVFINAADSAHDLKLEKQELLEEQLRLKNSIAKSLSLQSLSSEQLATYEPITQPVIIAGNTNVALSTR